MAAGGFGVGIEIDGDDFAVADGQPSAVAQVFARIKLDLGGLGEQAGNMVFKAAVALGIQSQGFAFGRFQVQAVEIGGVQRFEEVGQFFLVVGQCAGDQLAFDAVVEHGNIHFFVVVNAVELPFVSHVGMIQIGNRAVGGYGENFVAAFRCA